MSLSMKEKQTAPQNNPPSGTPPQHGAHLTASSVSVPSSTGRPPAPARFLPALCAYGMVLMFARYLTILNSVSFLLFLSISAVPVALLGFHRVTLAKVAALTPFVPGGRIAGFLARRSMLYAFWLLYAIVVTAIMLVKLHSYSLVENSALSTGALMATCVYFWIRRPLARELKPQYRELYAIRAALCLSSLTMIVMLPSALYLLGEQPGSLQGLQEIVNARAGVYQGLAGCPVAHTLATLMASLDGIREYGLSLLAGKYLWLALLLLVGDGLVYFNVFSIVIFFASLDGGMKRIFLPLDAEETDPVGVKSIAIIAFCISFVFLFIYLPAFGLLRSWVQHEPSIRAAVQNPGKTVEQRKESITQVVVETIGGRPVAPGTIDKLRELQERMLRETTEKSRQVILSGIDAAYDQMSRNVDHFLDWYYSLGAEYSRLGQLLVGDVEEYIQKQLLDHLQADAPEQRIQEALEQAKDLGRSLDAYRKQADAIIKDAAITLPERASVAVERDMPLESIFHVASTFQDKIHFEYRAAVSGGAAGSGMAIGALIAKKVLAKVASKSVFKAAVQAVIKLAAGKAAGGIGGAAAGAAVGAAIGSFVPVVGTALGAATGAVIGSIAVGVTVDKTLLVLEEAVSRDSFRQEITEEIEKSRQEMKRSLEEAMPK